MKADLLEVLICPRCHGRLELISLDAHDGLIETGVMICSRCGCPYLIEAGIPNMLADDLPRMAEKKREARGWVEISQKENWYIPTPEIDLALPDVVGKLGWDPKEASGWLATKHSFEEMMATYVRPGMRVLEIGAAKTWAGRMFVEVGCSYCACDIVADPNIGLGRARFFMEQSGCHYEVVAADAENLPFVSDHFDLVFAIAALHHALDLPKMLQEMTRVTRKGGILAGLNEGIRSFRANPNAASQEDEKTYGINEHVHTLWGYYRAFAASNLRVLEMKRAIGYEWFIPEEYKPRLARLRQVPQLGEWLAAIAVMGFRHEYDGVTIYARK
jgi:uncharacterized protein YbaR (Trm112 family)/ubiquinone/menaquinone biosynthesis C-methylase UbiE